MKSVKEYETRKRNIMKSTFTFVLFTWCVLPVIALDDASLRGIDSWERLLNGNGNNGNGPPCTGGPKTCTVELKGNSTNYKEVGKICCGDEECQPEGEETFLGSDTYSGTCVPKKCFAQSNVDDEQERGSHRVTICHRTCSEKNPWVRITIDNNAFNDNGCGHQIHNVNETCTGKNFSKWGGFNKDYVIRDHGGSKNTLALSNNWTKAEEKTYWRKWERACPFVRNGNCCDETAGECCGIPKPPPPPGTPNITLDKTVHKGELGTCDFTTPDTEEITVEIADPLTFCYKICNSGNTKLCHFQLYDNTNYFTWTSAVNLCLDPGICTFAPPNPWAFCLGQSSIPANVTGNSAATTSEVTAADNAIVNVKNCKEKPQTTRNVGLKSACKNPRGGWPIDKSKGPVRPTICYPKSNYIFPMQA